MTEPLSSYITCNIKSSCIANQYFPLSCLVFECIAVNSQLFVVLHSLWVSFCLMVSFVLKIIVLTHILCHDWVAPITVEAISPPSMRLGWRYRLPPVDVALGGLVVSVVAIGPEDCCLETSQGLWIFKGNKNPIQPMWQSAIMLQSLQCPDTKTYILLSIPKQNLTLNGLAHLLT
jgi:hypothetical protein